MLSNKYLIFKIVELEYVKSIKIKKETMKCK